MYQSIIRDPGGNGLIRIQPGVCGQYSAIVNGSILIVHPEPLRSLLSMVRFRVPTVLADMKSSQALTPSL